MSQKYRLITRSDFDGLVCAMILKEMRLLNDIKFVHPKDMQDGLIPVDENDISTNLPYAEGIHLAFDHHSSEERRVSSRDNFIIDPDSPSTARVVYKYYGGAERLPRVTEEIMRAVDKSDSAQFTMEDIVNPTGWDLLSFLMDARTGLGRFHNFRVSNYELMKMLIDACLSHSIDEILLLPDVKERVDLYWKQQELFKEQIKKVHTIDGDVIVLHLREEEQVYAGNRFLVYAMFPQVKVSIHVMWGLKERNTVLAIGKSIINRRSHVNIGGICARYGGGGHHNAGTCQIPNNKVDVLLPEIVELLNS